MKYFFIVVLLLRGAAAYGQAASDLTPSEQAASLQGTSGIALEYRFGLMTEATHAPNIVNQFGVSGYGNSSEHTFRLVYEGQIASLGTDFAIVGAAGLGDGFGTFTSDVYSGPMQFTLSSNTFSAYIRGGLSCCFSNFALQFSGWVAPALAQSLKETLITNGTSSTFASNSSIQYSRVPTGIRFEADYTKPLFARVSIGFFSELDLEAYRQMGMSATSGGLELRWNFERIESGSIISPKQ